MTKAEIEREIIKNERESAIFRERIIVLEKQMVTASKMVKKLVERAKGMV